MKKNWYSLCPVCSQGRLMVMKRQDDCSLLLLCEECESAWKDPEDATDVEQNISIAGLDVVFATADDIAHGGWSQYSMKEYIR